MLLGERLSSCTSRGGPSGAEGGESEKQTFHQKVTGFPGKVKQDVASPASLVVTVRTLLASLWPTLLTAKMRSL